MAKLLDERRQSQAAMGKKENRVSGSFSVLEPLHSIPFSVTDHGSVRIESLRDLKIDTS